MFFLTITTYSYNVSLQVAEMKKELVDLQPKLEQAKIDNNKMMKVNTCNRIHTHMSYGASLFPLDKSKYEFIQTLCVIFR